MLFQVLAQKPALWVKTQANRKLSAAAEFHLNTDFHGLKRLKGFLKTKG
ncbi:MAG: hypothetical protein Q4A17_02630 [Thermoguttaceae bacterium]|nr:hypothetical protein [Thermoguttaceae bacterium]